MRQRLVEETSNISDRHVTRLYDLIQLKLRVLEFVVKCGDGVTEEEERMGIDEVRYMIILI
jgi:hypothetical protein